jgi:predicted type IV restriction endonuclease
LAIANADEWTGEGELRNIYMEKFFLQTGKLLAEATYEAKKLTIIKGSQAKLEISASFPKTQRELRDELINMGILKETGNVFVFTRDYICNSPSQASNLITGTSSNGMIIWKDNSGKTLQWHMRQEE